MCEGDDVFIGYYDDEDEDGPRYSMRGQERDPTHWQPLPQPPAAPVTAAHRWASCHDAGPRHDPRRERACVCAVCGGAFVLNGKDPAPPCPGAPVAAAQPDGPDPDSWRFNPPDAEGK